MSKVNCVQADWQQDVSAIADLNAGGGAANSIATLIQDSFNIITDAEDTISRLDVDGEITAVFDTASVGKYQVGSFPALTEILHKYSKNAPSAIRNDIDLPFNMKLDTFLGAMSNVDIKSYSTAATGSLAKSGDFTTGNAGVVTIKDLLEPSTPLGKQLKREYIEFKNKIGDDFTYDDYQMMVMNLASYNYDSFLEALAKGSAAFALTVAVTSIPVIGPIISFGMSGVGAVEGIWGAATGNSLLTGKKLTSEEKVLSGIFGAMNLAFAGLTAYNGLKGKVKLPTKKASGANNFKFGNNVKNHLKNVENVNTKKGVIGGHNLDEFNNALTSQGVSLDELIVSKKPHPSIEGIYEIEYRIPKKDITGNVAKPITYKNIDTPKTVYDPSVFSETEIYNLGVEAMQNGKIIGGRVEGTASNGLNFIGYLDDAGNVKNFFPILD